MNESNNKFIKQKNECSISKCFKATHDKIIKDDTREELCKRHVVKI